MRESDTVRVRVETPDATFDGSVNNPAEWDALVAFLEHKVRYPMETERVQEDSDTGTEPDGDVNG